MRVRGNSFFVLPLRITNAIVILISDIHFPVTPTLISRWQIYFYSFRNKFIVEGVDIVNNQHNRVSGRLKALGQKVKDLRNERNLTLQQLAHSIGKNPQSIHRLEQGGVNPSYLYLMQICEGLEIEIADLLKGLED